MTLFGAGSILTEKRIRWILIWKLEQAKVNTTEGLNERR